MSMAVSPLSFKLFSGAAVVMGVAGCGKTTLGEALATALGVDFIEGDMLHAAASVDKMSNGIALNDEDRWPWLARIGNALAGGKGIIASCSALKKTYRQKISEHAGRPVHFIHLHGSRHVLEARIQNRKGHFMPASLLDSQFATLQQLDETESHIVIDVAASPGAQLVLAQAFLVKKET